MIGGNYKHDPIFYQKFSWSKDIITIKLRENLSVPNELHWLKKVFKHMMNFTNFHSVMDL